MRPYPLVKKLVNLVVLLVIPSLAMARMASLEDASAQVTLWRQNLIIKKDGTYEGEYEVKIKILRESARDYYSAYTLRYNEAIETLAINSAKTYYQGQEYPVTNDMVEDKPLASEVAGFDQTRQLMVVFPKVEVGSEIYLSYKRKVSKTPIPGMYNTMLSYGADLESPTSIVTIESELPLRLHANDPTHALKVTTDKPEWFTKARFELTKPVFFNTINEPHTSLFPAEKATWVAVSSYNKYEDISAVLGPDILEVFNQPLPEAFKEIAEAAAGKESEVDQINIVTSLLNDKVRYHGDWRTIKGMYIPRDLRAIAESQVGDCKDFSASTGAILKSLGYTVFPAMVFRGATDTTYKPNVPVMEFNHAIIKVVGKTGKTYWVDATNFTSMAEGIYPDIADRMALVIGDKTSRYERIPPINPDHSVVTVHRKVQLLENNKARETAEVSLYGEVAQFFTGAELHKSPASVKDSFFDIISDEHPDDVNRKMELSSLNSRIVTPIHIKAEYELSNKLLHSNLGLGIELKRVARNEVAALLSVKSDTAGDIALGTPIRRTYKTVIKDVKIKNAEKLNVNIDSSFLSYRRKVVSVKGDVEIEEEAVVHKSVIKNNELQSKEFKKLRDDLRDKVNNSLLIFS